MIQTLLNLVFPVDCVLCRARVREWRSGCLCPPCEATLQPPAPPYCERCGLPAPALEGMCGRCLRGETAYDFGRAALVFAPRLRTLIHQFKYNDRVSLARPLGRALRRRLEAEPFRAEVVVPMPLDRQRERERGYNQAQLLAAGLGRRVDATLVRRRRRTGSQTGLTRAQRAENVRSAFEHRRAVPETVLIVDDVQTTGATINELARTLRRGGARRVEVLTLARVAYNDP